MNIKLAFKLLPFFISLYSFGQIDYDVKTPTNALNSLCRILIERKQSNTDEVITESFFADFKSKDEAFALLQSHAPYWLKALENNDYTFAPKNYDHVVNISLRSRLDGYDTYYELIFIKDAANNWKFAGYPEE